MNRSNKKYKNKIGFISVLVLTVAMTVTLSSCITIRVNSLKGSGTLKTQSYEIDDFNVLDFSGIGNIEISTGR